MLLSRPPALRRALLRSRRPCCRQHAETPSSPICLLFRRPCCRSHGAYLDIAVVFVHILHFQPKFIQLFGQFAKINLIAALLLLCEMMRGCILTECTCLTRCCVPAPPVPPTARRHP